VWTPGVRSERDDLIVVRYADDNVLIFQHLTDADRFLVEFRERLQKFGMEALMESSAWQGPVGKRLLGIKVIDIAGRRISFGRAALRTVCKVPSGAILFIGFLMASFRRRKKALHDLIAGCLVVRL
jgi:hypothetical protein